MATEITEADFTAQTVDPFAEDEAALAAAHAQALYELERIRQKASVDDSTTTNTTNYSMHEVTGIGRYVIPRRLGWKPLIEIIHDPVPNVDFSANVYPAFDGIIGEHFQSPYMLDPLDDHYESFEDLRDNLAAVRNFLMQSYYANSPEGMTPGKAKQALAEIAAFVGDGLDNNKLFYGIIPNHNPTKSFIDLSRAREPGGRGAQYIYEKILEHQRHSNWMRPFDAVMALFGGKTLPDWQLPSADSTHFTDKLNHDIISKQGTDGASPQSIESAMVAQVSAIEARLNAVRDARALTTTAIDLDAIGNHLLFTAENMDGVAHLSDPVRRDAVDIARDILRKLKFNIGELLVVDGLKMKPTDDMAALGAIKGVAMVYERLLAWARGNNDAGILQHPSIIAATQAIGQLGALAKREGLRMAIAAGNTGLAETIGEQIKRIPSGYASSSDTTFGGLLDKVERGIDTVINRTQQVGVSGGAVGFSRENASGTGMNAAPLASNANQAGVDAARRNAQAAMADQLAAQAQAQRIHSQLAAQARGQQGQSAAQAPQPAARSGSSVGRQSLSAARTQQRASSTTTAPNSTTPPTAPLTPAQQIQAMRSATAAATAQAARERDEMLAREQQQLAQQKATAAIAKARAAVQKIDPTMLKGFKSATSLQGVTGAPIMGGRAIDPKSIQASMNKPAVPAAPATTAPKPANVATPDNDPLKNPYAAPLPPGVQPQGRGRF